MGAAWGAVIGGLVGAGKGMFASMEDKQKAQREGALAIAQTRAAPLFSFQDRQAIRPGEIKQYPTQMARLGEGISQGVQAGSSYGMGNLFGGGGKAGSYPGGQAGQNFYGDQQNATRSTGVIPRE